MASSSLSRRRFLQTASAAGAMAATSSDRPNIIFLMADEHRYDALGCAGNPAVHSPHLDRMASQGATMLDLAGAQLPTCGGRSLVPMIKGRGKGRDVVHSELAGHQNKGNFFVMAANRRYRYLYDKENKIACELYDLEKDHDEMHNLVDDPSFAGIRNDMHKDYVLPFMDS